MGRSQMEIYPKNIVSSDRNLDSWQDHNLVEDGAWET